ncbi:uncharacterized protein LOC103522307, partial [Diaphorina citri]|uniref:Uncharacterized protein LOC103522307 n=1 Tax=Diaphorina citri TaxID=121845 RepID=A0A3Q0JIW3_DIACI
MIPSSLIWGFVTDFKGRQNVLFYGLLGDIFSNLCSALSTSFELLVLFRVLTGIAMCATFSSCYTLLVEYLVQSRRDSGVMMLGCFGSAGSFIQPTLAVNMTMISGRVGVLLGSLLFSVFIERACQVSFLFLAAINLVCAFIMTFCLTERTAEDPEIPHEKLPRLSLDEDMPPLAISVEQLTAEDLREARLSPPTEDPEIPHEKLSRLSLDEDMPPLAISVEQLTAEDLREARLSSENIAQGKGEPLSQDT